MSGKGAKGLIMGKASAGNKDKDKKKPISRSSRAGLQVLFQIFVFLILYPVFCFINLTSFLFVFNFPLLFKEFMILCSKVCSFVIYLAFPSNFSGVPACKFRFSVIWKTLKEILTEVYY